MFASCFDLYKDRLLLQICAVEFDRKDIMMNKLVATTLEAKFHVFDLRTFHLSKGYASLVEKVCLLHRLYFTLYLRFPTESSVYRILAPVCIAYETKIFDNSNLSYRTKAKIDMISTWLDKTFYRPF